jgi:hypothetical protein
MGNLKKELTDDDLYELLSVLADVPARTPEETEMALARLREAIKAQIRDKVQGV